MRVFISWSGDRSKQVAQALRNWLPDVIQDIDPWMSQSDIDAGARWTPEVSEALEKSHFGIVCLTRDNTKAPWLFFEAGALSKVVSKARVCVYLLDLKPEDYSGPLTLFQATSAEEGGTKAIIHSINRSNAEDKRIAEERLDRYFGTNWPRGCPFDS